MLKESVLKLQNHLRLRTSPVGFKLLEKVEDMQNVTGLMKLKGKSTMCQLVTIARTFEMTVGATADDLAVPVCGGMIGLCDLPDIVKDGTMRQLLWCKKKEDAKKYENSIPKIPVGKYKAVVIGPLAAESFNPDIVLIYGTPAQMILLINAIQVED